MEASCHCGAVRIEVRTAPETVTDCNCSICRRYGILWAYYPPEHVQITQGVATTQSYVWGDREIAFHRCATCGCVTHDVPIVPPFDRVAVNTRLMPLDVFRVIPVRRVDNANT